MPLANEMVELRPATLSDLDAVYALIAQQNTADFGSALQSLEELRQRWLDTDFSLANQTLVAVATNGQLVGYAEIRPSHPRQFFLQLYLSSALASPALGLPLLAAIEANLPPGTALMAQVSGKNVQNQQAQYGNQGATRISTSEGKSALPRLRTLWINSKNPR